MESHLLSSWRCFFAGKMTYSARFVKDLKDLIGEKPVEYILTEVRKGSFLENEAGKFADDLNPEAFGAFINSKIVYGEDAMELILSKWFERGQVFLLTKEKAVRSLIGALEKARKTEMAFKISNVQHGFSGYFTCKRSHPSGPKQFSSSPPTISSYQG